MTWVHYLTFLNLYDRNNNNAHRIVVGIKWGSISVKQQSFTFSQSDEFKMKIWSNASVLRLPLSIKQNFHVVYKPCVVCPPHLFSIFLFILSIPASLASYLPCSVPPQGFACSPCLECSSLLSSPSWPLYFKISTQDFPGGAVVKNPPANAGDTGSSPGPGRSHMLRST